MSEQTNKKLIARNTIMLYIRMIISTVVSLYTSRVVLQTLGVEDYGIYGVVGGIVSMFSFLNAAMSGATSRFLTYAIGEKNENTIRDTFSSAMIIHVLIAFGIFIVAETIGVWFLCNKLVIPENRMFAAHVVYQFSIISMFFNVTQVPYNSLIVAHEKIDVYAYVELLNVFLKLGIVYLLVVGNWDKLILYAGLMLLVSVIVAMTYRIYCLKVFPESKFRYVWKKFILKPMISFSGWDLYGNMSVVFFTQSMAVLLNMFFGPILNAANNVSITVQGTIKSFAYNVIQAFRPQIIKQYAQGNMEVVNQFVVMATQYTLVLFSFIAIPFFFDAEYILHLWLGVVPEHTATFLRIVLIGTIFNLANNIVNIPIHAKGKMKLFSLMTGTCFLMSIPLMYLILKMGANADVSYLVILVSYICCFISSLYILKRNVPSVSLRHLFFRGYFKYVLTIIPGIFLSLWIDRNFDSEILKLFGVVFVNSISLIFCMLYIMMNRNEREKCISFILSKIRR